MDDVTQRRAAKHEATSRRVNEAIDAHSAGERRSPGSFICECSRLQCDHFVEITPRDYERIHRDPRRFIVRPGHEQAEVETIIEAHSDYIVVEKQDEAGRQAEAEAARG